MSAWKARSSPPRAESNLYRSWGADVIGMTNLQEAKLAREAEICYATVAMVTDYDCWREGHDAVTIEEIVAVLHQNADERGQGGEGGRGRDARRAHLRLRLRGEVRRAHAAGRDSRSGKRKTEAAVRQVSRLVERELERQRSHSRCISIKPIGGFAPRMRINQHSVTTIAHT